ncbi:MAG: carbonic anhydrase [Egibacteraceae bacterium]
MPTALLVVAGAAAAPPQLGLADVGVATLGDVPSGLPRPALPAITLDAVIALLPSAAAIALISYLEGISVAKAIAAKTRQRIDANAELVASGAANLAAGVFQSFPVAGGFSRTAVNHQAGARTPMASLITASVVALTVTFLTPLFFHLPRAVLAAVIVVVVAGLVDLDSARHAWRVRRSDAAVLGLTFAATLLIGVEPGIATGVAASLAMLLWRTANPHTAELGRVTGTARFRNTDRYPTRTDPTVAILRIDGPRYFASAKRFDDRVTSPHRHRTRGPRRHRAGLQRGHRHGHRRRPRPRRARPQARRRQRRAAPRDRARPCPRRPRTRRPVGPPPRPHPPRDPRSPRRRRAKRALPAAPRRQRGTPPRRGVLMPATFATAITCIHGRVHAPVTEWIRQRFGVDHVDLITAPGADAVCAYGAPTPSTGSSTASPSPRPPTPALR